MKNKKEFSFENPNNNRSMDIRRVKLISQSEWERLQKQLDNNLSETAKVEEKKLELEKIKAQSKEMIKNWTNTLLGGRQKKLEERANRLAEEEKAKLAIDREEAKYQAEQRKKAIDKAKLQLYYETDRVRLLHSGLILTETLKERDMQLEFKHLKNKLEEKKEKIYVEKMRKSIESAIKKEQEEAEKRHEKNMLMAQELTAQIKEHDEQKKRQKELILAEGEELRKIATTDLLEREKLEQIYREQMNKLAKEFLDQINGQKQMRDIERLRDEEIEEQCRLFAAAKIKMTKMRILKEREIFKLEYLSEQLKNAQNTEESRLNKAINEREEKYQQETKEKQEKQMKIMHEINEYRMNELERRRKLLEEKKEMELNEIRERIANELALIKKQENIKEERRKEIEMVENQNKLYQLEENIFQDYANRIINHCKANDRNVYPLEKAAHTKSIIGLGTGLPGKPSLVTINHNNQSMNNQYNNDHSISNNDQYFNKELNNNENLTNKNTTNERLGFVW
ncbi:Coiled-coil domain-containing protein [Schistosoma japonicum]|nr:Coiled-coil domain-containing protein [Schistosoma japonicum]